jgi:hypothetical protein
MLVTRGFHHITMVSSDAARTVRFYRELLGMGLVKRTVNYDDPSSYHLYFGDDRGTPGTLLTFFEWRGAGRGRPGAGGIHHLALAWRRLKRSSSGSGGSRTAGWRLPGHSTAAGSAASTSRIRTARSWRLRQRAGLYGR